MLQKAKQKNNSSLCVGLDPDPSKINTSFFEFGKNIIDQTKNLVCAYKPNLAFYSQIGIEGIKDLVKTIEYIHSNTDIPVILDTKCGDIGNTAKAYAKAIFEFYKADATTVNPYMGFDSIKPFADYKDKGVYVLCLTSNPSSADFENDVYLKVAKKVVEWNTNNNLGLVVGATKPDELIKIQEITKEMPLLIPGVGSQGGEIPKLNQNSIINASRSIIYADDPKKAAEELKNKCSG